LGIDRSVEYAAAVRAHEVGVGPEVVAFEPAEGWLVARFIEGSLGRRFTGKPVGTESGFHDAWYGGVGGQRSFGWGGSVTLMLDARSSVSDAGGDDIALTAAFAQRLSEDWKLNLYAARGMTRDAAQWEFGLSVGYRFGP